MRCVPCGLRTAAGAPLRRARRAGAGLSAVRQPRPRVARLATPRARPPRPCGPVEPGARGRRRRFASSAAEAAPPIPSPPPPLPRALPFIVLVVHCRRIARCAGLQCGEPPTVQRLRALHHRARTGCDGRQPLPAILALRVWLLTPAATSAPATYIAGLGSPPNRAVLY